jgi:nucleolar MIF4G domain-containing protein 1
VQLDAAERLLRLPLKGAAERDVALVIIHCCLQEEVYNRYYSLVMSRVAAVQKTHRLTMQNTLLDKLKEVPNLGVRQALNLSLFLADLLASQACLLPYKFHQSNVAIQIC